MPTLLFPLLLTILVGCPAFAQAQNLQCGPLPLGSPCAIGGVASAGAWQASSNLSAGNPINLASGNKYQQDLDLPAHPSARGLELVRHYNSLDPRSNSLGQGWQYSYDTRLVQAGERWQIAQADGSTIVWQGSLQAPLPGPYGTLEHNDNGWVWLWPNGRRLWFDFQGRLYRLILAAGQRIDIVRHPDGRLHEVRHSSGLSLRFRYLSSTPKRPGHRPGTSPDPAHTLEVQTPRGTFRYGTDTLGSYTRLRYVQRPDGMMRLYHYEAQHQNGNPTALTGVSLISADGLRQVRRGTWQYDAQGRATAWHAGHSTDPAQPSVHLSFESGQHPSHKTQRIIRSGSGTAVRLHTGTKHGRAAVQRIESLDCTECPQPGWPGLQLAYNADGRLHEWSSRLTGAEYWHYGSTGKLQGRRLADGSRSQLHYTPSGQLSRISTRRQDAHSATTLNWVGKQLRSIHHPNETESLHTTPDGRSLERIVQRPAAPGSTAPLIWRERLNYSREGRLAHHQLPEGGQLRYRWSADGKRLETMQWLDRQGTTHTVIERVAGLPGYRYGNGLHLAAYLNTLGQVGGLMLYNASGAPVWQARLNYSLEGRVAREQHVFQVDWPSTPGPVTPATRHASRWDYAYDTFGRLSAAQSGGPITLAPDPAAHDTKNEQYWYAWNADGSLAAARHNGQTQRITIERDPSGLPRRYGDKQLRYGLERRLEQASDAKGLHVRYGHNAHGQRIWRDDGSTQTDYLYLNHQLVAERERGTSATAPVTRRYLYAGLTPIGLIDYSRTPNGELLAVHADLVGAPRLVTDANGQARWLAHYDPLGNAIEIGGDIPLLLRLPGQLADPATGWHDNVLRTYLPQAGHYLEPDPLGPMPGQQALGYARQQPRRHVDPSGLILFAFDGTRHDASVGSNIWKLSQAYRDGPAYYHRGPGNSLYLDWNALTAADAQQILDTQWQHLLNAIERYGNQATPLNIDIIGFSRGAALAREFGNRIHKQSPGGHFSLDDDLRGRLSACIDLRFMGLFDTVAQFGILGSQNSLFDLSIAPVWTWVAHAVALHERRWLFPLSTAFDTQAHNVIEAPFIGAHADIGGGNLGNAATADKLSTPGDLADITLNWMAWQARAAGLLFELNADDRSSTLPLLHDERSAIARRVQNGDRSLLDSQGDTVHSYQHNDERLGHEPRRQTENLILREPNWLHSDDNIVGTIDMNGYARWLHDVLGWGALPA